MRSLTQQHPEWLLLAALASLLGSALIAPLAVGEWVIPFLVGLVLLQLGLLAAGLGLIALAGWYLVRRGRDGHAPPRARLVLLPSRHAPAAAPRQWGQRHPGHDRCGDSRAHFAA